ncbi:MAG: CapA family protein [Patescibacteria group bacterium]
MNFFLPKWLSVSVLILLLAGVIGGVYWYNTQSFLKTDFSQATVGNWHLLKDKLTIDEPSGQEIIMYFVGDVMLDRGVRQSVMNNYDGDYDLFLQNLSYLNSADIVFGNLEGPVSDQGQNLGNLYSFRMEPVALEALARVGFNVLSVANNHMGDWGREAFEDTLDRLEALNILAVGGGRSEDVQAVKILEIEGVKIGFLAFTDIGPWWLQPTETEAGMLWANHPDRNNIIKNGATETDILIVSFHFGQEYQERSTWRQRALSREAIEAGADLVIGHHPHVIQEAEWYQDGFIIYSLGNFIFDQYFSAETMEGLVLKVVLDSATKTIKGITGHLSTQTKDYQPPFLDLATD